MANAFELVPSSRRNPAGERLTRKFAARPRIFRFFRAANRPRGKNPDRRRTQNPNKTRRPDAFYLTSRPEFFPFARFFQFSLETGKNRKNGLPSSRRNINRRRSPNVRRAAPSVLPAFNQPPVTSRGSPGRRFRRVAEITTRR